MSTRNVIAARLAAGLMTFGIALGGCGGGGAASPATCVPADPEIVDMIQGVLAAYPEIGETLAGGAQQIAVSETRLDGAVEYRVLVAGRLEPSGQIGVWAGAYNTTQDVLMGSQPANEAALASMPEVIGPALADELFRLGSSEAGNAVIACVK